MNAEAKTLAAKLREAASRPGRDNPDYICVITGADALAAADFLDRLSAPVEGVGLTRYRITDRTYQAAAIRSLSTED